MPTSPSPFTNTAHILLDIEGTILPISFVKNTLFPYALTSLPSVLAAKWDDQVFSNHRSAFPETVRESPATFEAHVRDLTVRNEKVAYFKDLQGYLWASGYESQAYSSPFFADVVPALHRWKDRGVQISIYSSGSVFAQKLLFGHVDANTPEDPKKTVDLTGLVTEWFDTTNAGPKMEAESYTNIAGELRTRPERVLFFSDNIKELEAAREVGMKTVLMMRAGNEEVSGDERDKYGAVETFERMEVEPEEEKTRG